ncbi:MAG: TonB-dependent receptor plug domain-containing protein, partial [Pseudomonadota bacterium]
MNRHIQEKRRYNNFRVWLCAGSAAAALCAAGGGAFAQSEATEVDTIIITGEKRERSLQDTTSSVGVFTSESLRENAIDSLDEILRLTPNVSGNLDQLTIRGIGTFGVSDLGGDSFNGQTSLASSIVIDDVIIPQNILREGFTDLWDVGQVEVFRGPQSTNQGRNALSGGIVINTVEPGSEFSATVQGVVQELNGYRASGAVGGPIAGDALSARFSVDWNETDGFIDLDPQSGSTNPTGSESVTLRSKFLFTPDSAPNFSARLALSHVDQERALAFQSFDDPNVTSTGTRLSETQLTTAALRLEYDLSDALSLTSITTGVYQDNETPFEDNDGTTLPLGFVVAAYEETTYTQELRFDYDAGGRFKLLGGVYYYDSVR